MTRPILPSEGDSFTNGKPWTTVLNNAVNQVSDVADQALALAQQGSLGAGESGVVALDSFAGADDDAKLTAALSYAAAQTYIPIIRLPGRQITFNQGGRTPFTGLKIHGPHADNPKGLEQGGGKNSNHKVILNVGSDASSWFYGTTTNYYMTARDLAFQAGNSGAQFWAQPAGTIYAAQFHSLDFVGFKGVFGNEATKALLTQCLFTGHWATHGHQGVQYHIGGSDNQFWKSGYININSPTNVAGAGRPQIWLDGCQKSDIGYTYITCEGDWGGARVSGGADRTGNAWFNPVMEGRGVSNPSSRPVLEIQGGGWSFYGGWYGQVNPTGNNGTIIQSGGDASFYSPAYMRADVAPDTFPFIYQSAGTCQVSNSKTGRSGELVRVRFSTGTTAVASAPANSLT